ARSALEKTLCASLSRASGWASSLASASCSSPPSDSSPRFSEPGYRKSSTSCPYSVRYAQSTHDPTASPTPPPAKRQTSHPRTPLLKTTEQTASSSLTAPHSRVVLIPNPAGLQQRSPNPQRPPETVRIRSACPR